MSVKIKKINGYKQIEDAVYKFDKTNSTYRFIGKNKSNLSLEEYVLQRTKNWQMFISATKELLR